MHTFNIYFTMKSQTINLSIQLGIYVKRLIAEVKNL